MNDVDFLPDETDRVVYEYVLMIKVIYIHTCEPHPIVLTHTYSLEK